MKDVIREGHETLRKKAQLVIEPFSKEDKEQARELLEYVINSQNDELAAKYDLRPGVGLAAPQINVSKRIIGVHTTDETGEKLYSYALINPKIISHSEEKTFIPTGEGCLSVDRDTEGIVPRYKRITVEGYHVKKDLSIEKVSLRLSGFVSVVFQHEIDHLDGILFFDHINKENPYGKIENSTPIFFE